MAEPRPPTEFSPDLAGRLQKALTAGREELFHWVRDPSQTVLQTLLKNPGLDEEHLLALLKRPDLQENLIKAVYQRVETAASHRLKLALVRNPATPSWMSRSLLSGLHLFELVDLCVLPGSTPDQKLAAEREIVLRMESIPLGNKITLARRGTATIVGELLKQGHPQLMEPCLDNPRLTEAPIVQFLRSHRADAGTISSIARHPHWKNRPNVRQALLKNRRTPEVWFTLFLPGLHRKELKALLVSRQLTSRQKSLVEKALKRHAT
jgi:hypothetical protein